MTKDESELYGKMWFLFLFLTILTAVFGSIACVGFGLALLSTSVFYVGDKIGDNVKELKDRKVSISVEHFMEGEKE